jgi:putative transposase
MIIKAFKYQLFPNSEQQEKLNKTFGCVRFIYNWGLNEKSKAYSNDKININCFELINKVTELKKQEEFSWLKDVHSQTLQMSLRNLDNAYTNFFKKKNKFPKFKKKSNNQSFQYPQGVKINEGKVFLPKIGWIGFDNHRNILGEIKTVTVSKTPTGKYFVSIVCDTKLSIPNKKSININTSVGVDLGIKNFAILSNGKIFENQKYLTNKLKQLRKEQRKLQRCKQGSKNREKQRIIVAKIHEKITNQRLDYIHKISYYLTENFDTICLEDLNIVGMIKNHNLSRSIGEQGWNILNNQLLYKCEWKGIGLAFQIIDDILGVTATKEELGKTPNIDVNNKKHTFVDVLGLDGARKRAQQEIDEAKECLNKYGDRATALTAIADYFISRTH